MPDRSAAVQVAPDGAVDAVQAADRAFPSDSRHAPAPWLPAGAGSRRFAV